MVAQRKPAKPRARAVKDAERTTRKKLEPTQPAMKHDLPQAGIFDKKFTNQKLYECIVEKFRLDEAVKNYNRNARFVREQFAAMPGLKDGDRIQVASDQPEAVPFIITAKERRGGGHDLKAWTRIGVGKITKVAG